MGAVVAVLAPVALVGAAHTGQAPGERTRRYTQDVDRRANTDIGALQG